ncbi:peptidoglycan/LPS O-acetylase OafA/YrhL [Algoriphagus boseongensis]|uniref:Peptidoglycan/LPS O-acetylase OafA/YrhL n=1 Tax=Algoriphagus boseongensis TaxID=1442587 RepID=A0A4R6T5Y0_9BACT|nr:acyltransferase [Algoriphagus boseongensis]TDQ17062.1 peptidoglycan/LPS O-acetylase OafA/YrhL [Algoriphagus boseongensis]
MRFLQKIQALLIRTPASGQYLRFIDGLRFLAILPVVLQHANERLAKYGNIGELSTSEDFISFLISRGTIGVFLFFAISGFVLTLPFAKQKGSFSYKQYLTKRLRRIEPPFLFWISIFALVLLVKATYGPGELLLHYLATITYTHQLFFQEYSWINPVAWSLEVEIQFYLAAPFLAMAYFSFSSIGKRQVGLGLLILVWIFIQHFFGWQLYPWKASILGHFQHFLVGMLAADLFVNPRKVQLVSWAWDILPIPLAFGLAFTWTDELGKTLLFELLLLLLLVASWNGRFFKQFLSLSWIAIIGGMCYTTYLTHLPLMEALYSFIGDFGHSTGYLGQLSISLILVLPMILFSSIVFYRWIEQPFMKPSKTENKKEVSSLGVGQLTKTMQTIKS